MKKVSFVLFLIIIVALFTTIILNHKKNMGKKVMTAQKDRLELSNEKYKELFGSHPTPEKELDPELMLILRKSIFGDVFHSGILDNKTREMITVTVLATMQTLPQLKSYSRAALNNGVSPIELRELIY